MAMECNSNYIADRGQSNSPAFAIGLTGDSRGAIMFCIIAPLNLDVEFLNLSCLKEHVLEESCNSCALLLSGSFAAHAATEALPSIHHRIVEKWQWIRSTNNCTEKAAQAGEFRRWASQQVGE